MEPVLPAEDSRPSLSEVYKETAPWNYDNSPGSAATYNLCKDYIRVELGITMRDSLLYSAQDWHALLLDAYRELVALGIVIPPAKE